MARKHRARFVCPRPATKIWIGDGLVATAIGASSIVLVTTLSAAVLLLRPFTVLRTHIDFYYRSD